MKRIGLVIFLTILVGLILNISLILNFKASVSEEILNGSLILINTLVLGFSIWLMLKERLYLSHTLTLIVVYLFVFVKVVSSLYFVDYVKNEVYIDTICVIKDIKTYDQVEYRVELESVNSKELLLHKQGIITDFEGLGLKIGDRLNATIKVSTSEENYSLSKASEFSGTFFDYEKIGESFRFRKKAKEFQDKIYSILENTLGSRYSDIIGAFLIGTSIDDIDSKNALITSGIYHIMAISGLHIGILSGILLFVFNRILYRRTASGVTILMLFIYGCITGFSFSTTRAFLVVSIGLLGKILSTKDDNLNSVGVVGALIIINNPLGILNLGFVYSFTVVFGLVLTTPTIIYGLKTLLGLSVHRRYIVVDYFATIITAQLYFVPISLYYFGNLYIYALVVNALTIFVVPTLFVSSLGVLIFYGTFISDLVAVLVRFLVDYILLCANYFNTLPFAEIVLGQPKIIFLGIYYVVLFGVSYYATKNIYEVNNGHFRKTEIFEEW